MDGSKQMKDNIRVKGVDSKLGTFLQPDDKVIDEVEKLAMYYQFCNQDGVKLFQKWEKPKKIKGQTYYFKGSFRDSMVLDEMRDLLDRSKGKPWDTILRAIFLVKHYQTDLNLTGLNKLTPDEQKEYMEIVINGQNAYETVSEWVKPLQDKKKDYLSAIEAGNKIKIGNDEYDDFQVLRFGDVNPNNTAKGVKLYENLLEIDEPGALAEYFKNRPEISENNILFVTMTHPSKERDWKIEINLYFIWKGVLYNINFGERRFNRDNTAGDRNPDRYVERQYEKIWPLYNAITMKKSKTMAIELQKKQVTRRANIFEMLGKNPEASVWLEMFLLRLLDYIERSSKEIVKGFTTLDYVKMLPDKTQKIEMRIKTSEHRSSFESINDASSYLLKKYESKLTGIIPVVSQLPKVVGTQDYVEGVIKYQQRIQIADKLEKLNYADYKQNSPVVYKWFKDFIFNFGVEKFVERAMEDNKYERIVVAGLGDEAYVDGKKVKAKHGMVRGKVSILDRAGYFSDDEPLEIVLQRLYLNSDNYRTRGNYKIRDHTDCILCKKFAWYITAQVTFNDYNQICEFFNIKPEELPKEFVEHLHQLNEVYVGNSILDDTDPVDEIKDHWFRDHYKRESDEDVEKRRADGEAYISVIFGLCKRCSGKLGEHEATQRKTKLELKRKERWWDRRMHKEKKI